MVKRHLKRHASPSTWKIERKDAKFVVKPRPGGHKLAMGMSITSILKGLGVCETTREIKKVLITSVVVVNGKRIKDFKYLVGFMDTFAIPEQNFFFRMSLNEKGKLAVVPTDAADARLLPCRVQGMSLIGGGIMQLNCHNGYNIRNAKAKVGDTMLLDLETKGIVQQFPLKEGSTALFTGGSLAGKIGILVKQENKNCTVKVGEETHLIPTRYVFILGDKQSAVKAR